MTQQGGAFRMRKPIMIHALFLMIAFFIYIQSHLEYDLGLNQL